MSFKTSFAKIIKHLDWGDPYYFSYPTELKEEQKAPNDDNDIDGIQ